MCKCILLFCLGRNVNLRNGNVPAQDDPDDIGSVPELAPECFTSYFISAQTRRRALQIKPSLSFGLNHPGDAVSASPVLTP